MHAALTRATNACDLNMYGIRACYGTAASTLELLMHVTLICITWACYGTAASTHCHIQCLRTYMYENVKVQDSKDRRR